MKVEKDLHLYTLMFMVQIFLVASEGAHDVQSHVDGKKHNELLMEWSVSLQVVPLLEGT